MHKTNQDPLEHFIETSKNVAIGMLAQELKEFEDKERMKDYMRKSGKSRISRQACNLPRPKAFRRLQPPKPPCMQDLTLPTEQRNNADPSTLATAQDC